MKAVKHLAAIVAIGASLALPAIAVAGAASPGVISFDHGSLDTLDELGLGNHVLAVPKQSLPAYLSDYASDDYPDAGGLKTPSIEVVDSLDPDLVLVTGRQGELVEALQAVAEVRDVSLPEGSFKSAINTRVLGLAALFAHSDQAEMALEKLWAHVDSQKDSTAGAPQVLVVTHNDGNFSLRTEPVVSELLGLSAPNVPDGVEPMTRGTRTFTPLTPENIATMAPDLLLVVDRSAAIGDEPLDSQALADRLAKLDAEGTKVKALSPGLWYLSGGGLQSVRLQVDEVVEAL